jgi:hypothetical protein
MPVILVTLYYIPFLGILLLLFRYYIHSDKKYYQTSLLLLLSSLIIWLPKIIEFIIEYGKINIEIPYIYQIMDTSIYPKLLEYSKTLIIVGIILLIVSYILKNIFTSVYSKLMSLVQYEQAKDYEISKKNDLIIKEKQLKAKNSKVVHCKKCGASNIITSTTGKCKYCRSALS